MRNIVNRLATLPQVNIPRSKFDMPPFHNLTTMNAGELVPIFKQEVLPGSTYSLKLNQLVRMSTPIKPVMDDIYLDTYFFFCPNRLVYEHWEEFMGENKESYWTKDMPEYFIPMIKTDNVPIFKGSVADHFGLPVGVRGLEFSSLPFRMYALIWNDWFRDQNTMDPINIYKGELDFQFQPESSSYFNSATHGGNLCPVAKFHDYFTTSLPEPQRNTGEDVMLPLGISAPVVTSPTDNAIDSNYNYPLRVHELFGSSVPGAYNLGVYLGSGSGAVQSFGSISSPEDGLPIAPSNLITDLSNATSATINQLRMAVAVQSFYEASARYGGRYTELLRGIFGVTSPDSRLQRPEYIGGKRSKLNIQQTIQTSSTDSTTPQGNTAAFSLTVDSDDSFTYSSLEHGYLIGVACIRTKNTYQFGVDKSWSRKSKFDFYFPQFAHIGEQPVYNKEIYAQGNEQDNQVFGYQEAWAEYRQNFSIITGAFRSNYAQSLDFWHYSEDYDSLPTLSESFMKQSKDVVDRTLAVSSSIEDQFLCDFCFNLTAVLPIPLYSFPGFGVHL